MTKPKLPLRPAASFAAAAFALLAASPAAAQPGESLAVDAIILEFE